MMRERLFLIFSAKSLTLVKGDERVELLEERADAGLLREGGNGNRLSQKIIRHEIMHHS